MTDPTPLALTTAGPFPDFCRQIQPALLDLGRATLSRLWVTVKYTGGRLSITGVEGPWHNGDASGSSGQCGIREGASPAPGYTAADLAKLADIWDKWHLNDMRPYSPEMKALGWDKEAKTACWRHVFKLTSESIAAQKAAELAALTALRAGQPFMPTAAQAKAAARPYEVTIYAFSPNRPATPEGYEPGRDIVRAAALIPPERKTLGWVKPSEFPPGLLGRKVRESDSHGYGGKWWAEEVPRDVLDWLASLPLPPEGVEIPRRWKEGA